MYEWYPYYLIMTGEIDIINLISVRLSEEVDAWRVFWNLLKAIELVGGRAGIWAPADLSLKFNFSLFHHVTPKLVCKLKWAEFSYILLTTQLD